ncbi:MAG TPA: NosD domain-containing protein [Actinomycetota bacterium]|nr:NosD domain-containing protein [Actinomycetota bacterium]
MTWISTVVGALLAVALATAPASARQRVIQVHPGPNAIQDALDPAHAGDVLNLHSGVYRVPDGLVVDKGVVVRSAGDGTVTIDGRCKVGYTIHVTASNVRLRGLRVVGAAEGSDPFPAEVHFFGVQTGEVSGSVAVDTCKDGSGDGGAEYGISVFSSGPIQVVGNETYGFTDSGIYIGAISDTGNGTLRVQDNVTHSNARGVIVEDSSASIAVVGNRMFHNQRSGVEGSINAGLFLHNSDGVRIRDNTIANDDENGIWLDPDSANNRVVGNTISGHHADIRNDGTGNCFTGNTFTTHAGKHNGDIGHAC